MNNKSQLLPFPAEEKGEASLPLSSVPQAGLYLQSGCRPAVGYLRLTENLFLSGGLCFSDKKENLRGKASTGSWMPRIRKAWS